MKLMKTMVLAAGMAIASLASTSTASAAVANCSTLGPNLSYYDFDSCIITGSNGHVGKYPSLSGTVSAVFGSAITLNQADSHVQAGGGDSKSEFPGGFTELTLTQQLLDDFVFIHFKKSTNVHLFGLAGLSVGDKLVSAIGSDISHWGALAGTVPPAPQVPLPASGLLLIAALGGAGVGLRRRKG
ncbi:hypothetical protein OB2597_01242 [Pseudooceanicola batsensis HTCC2597]|uniref:Ice-binding protein C-terminal domain-containing protein n=1 Tax=Pseudooceanicola batsensis (strain ATCC BAA-863 / DSM 15984 / KCTC 12145 / HTCC2597) TaxID=252305 RepID=A3U2U1_PSEBH|nr:VPLPA-CTERM sorting domain-containing protein [Pseudooceanicola batsensis]EAQ01471.1 hypothetical protein OB2597_01242 [Pseudooceanicola batsensis HTCC2597]